MRFAVLPSVPASCLALLLAVPAALPAQRPALPDSAALETRIQRLEGWVARHPADRPARMSLIRLLWDQERWSEALTALEPLPADSQVTDARARLHVNAGIQARRVGNDEEAARHWRSALELRPGLTDASVYLALQLLRSGEKTGASTVLERGLTHAPEDPRLLALRAATMEGKEAREAAEEALRRMRTLEPDNEGVALELSNLLLASGRVDEARALHDTLLAAPDPGPRVYGAAGELWLLLEAPDSAVKVLEAGAARHGEDARVWRKLGEARAAGEDPEGALGAYRRAAALLDAPESVELEMIEVASRAGLDSWLRRTVEGMLARRAPRPALLEAAHRVAEAGAASLADSVYAVLLQEDSGDVEALLAAASLAERTGRSDQALTRYRRVLEVDPDRSPAILGILRLAPPEDEARLRTMARTAADAAVARLASMEQAQKAQVESRARTATGPSARGTQEGWKDARRRRRHDHARRSVEEALDRLASMGSWGRGELERLHRWYPESRVLLRYRARVAVDQGRLQQALETYDRLLRDRPEEADLHRERATVLEALGRRSPALTAWTRALELAPEEESAFRALLRLHREKGTLPELLTRIRRLATRRPDSDVLVERQIELLQRLGRLEEARALASERKET